MALQYVDSIEWRYDVTVSEVSIESAIRSDLRNMDIGIKDIIVKHFLNIQKLEYDFEPIIIRFYNLEDLNLYQLCGKYSKSISLADYKCIDVICTI